MTVEIFIGLFEPTMLLLVFLGVLFGVIMGAIPGLSASVGIALLLPITFSMPPREAVLMLGGIFMGGMYGGSITAILINVPGDVPAVCTAMDGFPLAKQGRAKEALYYSIFSSMFGGFIGIVALILFTPQLARIALKFGPPEMFLVALCGLAIVASLAGGNMLKAFLAVCVGLLIPMIGIDGMGGADRLTFGFDIMRMGISTVPIALGMFCFSEMFLNIGMKISAKAYYATQDIKRTEVIKRILKKWKLLIKSSLLGTLVGILPGIGGSVAIFLAYGEAKRTSKDPDSFGKGNVEGIIAAESANNALVGGAMVPMLALGIPGSATAALIGSALTIHGLLVGPDLFIKNPDIAYTFLYGMLLTVVAMAAIGAFGVKYFSLILKAKMESIIPVVIVFAMFGAYSINNSVFDVITAVILGLIGATFKRLGIPCAPVIIGAVLSQLIEQNFRRSLLLANAARVHVVVYIFKRPICIILFVLVILLFYFFFAMNKKAGRKPAIED